MSKQVEIKQNNWSSGISDDPRAVSQNGFTIAKNFDIFTNPNRLTPYRSFEADTETSVSATDLKQYFVRDFLYASTSAKLYGLGQTGAEDLLNYFIKQTLQQVYGLYQASSEGNGAVQEWMSC
jgi:hypothetical protein